MQARAAATAVLRAENIVDREVSFVEALAMQAIARAVSDSEWFYMGAITEATNRNKGNVHNLLEKMEEDFGLLASSWEEGTTGDGRTRQMRQYEPTEFGRRVFGLFAPGVEGFAEKPA